MRPTRATFAGLALANLAVVVAAAYSAAQHSGPLAALNVVSVLVSAFAGAVSTWRFFQFPRSRPDNEPD